MQKMIFAALAVTTLMVAPAAAQVRIHEGEHGVSVKVGEGPHYARHDCHTVVKRVHRHGKTIVSRTKVCD